MVLFLDEGDFEIPFRYQQIDAIAGGGEGETWSLDVEYDKDSKNWIIYFIPDEDSCAYCASTYKTEEAVLDDMNRFMEAYLYSMDENFRFGTAETALGE